MRLEKHLPSFISDVKQFKELDKTHTYELDKIELKIDEVQDDQFIETASSSGLSRYENMLNIVPDADIDIRRFNILAKFNSSIPFTMRWLINNLNAAIGQGMYLIVLDNNNYTLTVSIAKSRDYLIDSLMNDLRKKIPANIDVKLAILSTVEEMTYTGFYIRTADKNII